MRKGLVQIDGDWWPASDRLCRKAAMETVVDLMHAVAICENRKVAIQAGGNCGVWPRFLSEQFECVYTFEPNEENFLCLNLNTIGRKNIIKLQAALGNKQVPVSMKLQPENVGAHQIEKLGNIPVLRIDDLRLAACDLIQLDLEGYEYFALQGAVKTIDRHRPVLMLENKGHQARYAITQEELDDLLDALGYCLFLKVRKDIILIPNERKSDLCTSASLINK